MQFIDKLRLNAGVWLRERKERAAEKKAAKGAPAIEYGFDRTPRRIRFAVALATWGVIGFLILWVIQITGDLKFAVDLRTETGQPWGFDYDFRANLNIFPLLVLTIVSFAIVFWTKAWISLFASTPWSDWFTKLGALVLGIGGSVAIVMGGFEVNQHTRVEDFRGSLVEEQAAGQNRAAIQAQIDAVNGDLARLADRRSNNEYAANAANVGAEAYRRSYMSPEALARAPVERRDIIVRAIGAAERADALRAQRTALIGQLAAATPAAATQAVVEMQDPVSRFISSLGAWRIVILVVVGDLLLLLGNYFADRHEERNRYARSSQASGWADEAHRIEDKREEEAVTPKPMKPARRRYTDAETGDEIEEVLIQPKQPRPYKKERVIKKGEAFQVNLQPEIPPDETGAPYDGGGRTGSVEQAPAARGTADDDAEEQQPAASAEDVKDSADGIDQTDLSQDLPETPDEDVLAIFDLDEQQDNTEQASADEGEDTATRETPETDERRMIAAE